MQLYDDDGDGDGDGDSNGDDYDHDHEDDDDDDDIGGDLAPTLGERKFSNDLFLGKRFSYYRPKFLTTLFRL